MICGRTLARSAFYVLLGSIAAVLYSCGSGAVSNPPAPPAPLAPLAIMPTAATVYTGLPTTFLITGGTGIYIVTSTDQALVPIAGPVTSNAFTIVPRNVAIETPVFLGIRDTGSAVPISVTLTVKPIAMAPLTALPALIAFQGTAPNTCASGMAADVIVSGGVPPYAISQPGAFIVSPIVVTGNPGRFTIQATGQCAPASQVAIVDAAGNSTGVTASNAVSPFQSPPAPVPVPFAVSPTEVTLGRCDDTASVAILGGTGNYFAASGNNSVIAVPDTANTGLIRRVAAESAPATVSVVFSDGVSAVPVTVTLVGDATGQCS